MVNAFQGLAQGAQTRDQRLQLLGKADDLGDVRDRESVRKSILSVWAGTQPDEARAYVEGLADAARRSESARQVGHIFVGANPEKGAEWWLSQTSETDRPRALKEIVQRWTEADLVGAAKWMQTLGNGPDMESQRGNSLLLHK